jgi:hypothetical protein
MGCLFRKSLGQQFHGVAEEDDTSEVAALLSHPESLSFINCKNDVGPPHFPSPCSYCVSVDTLVYISL